MLKDCYGFDATSSNYMRTKKQPADVEIVGDVTYMRFSTDDVGPIHKITVFGSTTSIRWSWGDWHDKENLTFENDLNTPIDVEE